MNETLGKKSDHCEIEKTTTNNNIITDLQAIAQEFNTFFANIAVDLRASLKFIKQDFLNYSCKGNLSGKSFFFSPITNLEVQAIISSLENKFSKNSSDSISNYIVKECSPLIIDVLAYLFNLSFEKGIFPSALKRAIIIPIFKKGDKTVLNNYRPISLLSVFSKIFEKAVKSRLVNYLNKIEFFHPAQYGFRENRSTEDALLEFLNKAYSTLNSNYSSAALFVDITKAFDMVNHSILCKLLSSIGFRGCALSWFQSYLHNRSQQTRIGNYLSDELLLNIGVPQGSVLGPILFLIYINNIFEQPFKGDVVAFADDMALVYEDSDLRNI